MCVDFIAGQNVPFLMRYTHAMRHRGRETVMEELMRYFLALAGVLLATTASAEPFTTAPAVGTTYVYDTTTTGGTESVNFTMPLPPAGDYMVSFTANFNTQGTTSAPVGFSCVLIREGAIAAQSTSVSTLSSGWNIGVNGQAVMKIYKETNVSVNCGTISGSWTWEGRPLEVTFTRLAGIKSGSLANGPEAATKHLGITR